MGGAGQQKTWQKLHWFFIQYKTADTENQCHPALLRMAPMRSSQTTGKRLVRKPENPYKPMKNIRVFAITEILSRQGVARLGSSA